MGRPRKRGWSRHHVVPKAQQGCECDSNIIYISQKQHNEYNRRHGGDTHPWEVIKKLEHQLKESERYALNLEQEILKRLAQMAEAIEGRDGCVRSKGVGC